MEKDLEKDWSVLVERKRPQGGWRRAYVNKEGRKFTLPRARQVAAKLRKDGYKTKLYHDPEPRNYRVLVKRGDVKNGWREARYQGSARFTKDTALRVHHILRKRGAETRVRKVLSQREIDDARIAKWLSGDLDFDRDLQVRLSKVAQAIGWKLHVNYGKRTYAEQAALYRKYGPGRAARPGTSRHETGKAADVVSKRFGWLNLGRIPGARSAMRKYGVGLPVPGEPWHAEKTNVFRA